MLGDIRASQNGTRLVPGDYPDQAQRLVLLYNNFGEKHHGKILSLLQSSVLCVTETLLYKQYISVTTTITETISIEIVLEYAAHLRCILDARRRKGFVDILDKKLFAVFTTRYAKHLGAHGGETYVFNLYVSILVQISNDAFANRATIDFVFLTCKAINNIAHKNDLAGADALEKCGFEFANSQRFYHRRNCWGSHVGHKPRCTRIVFGAMEEAGIDLLALRFSDLSQLIHLLDEQENYQELEVSYRFTAFSKTETEFANQVSLQKLLLSLWRSREVQRNWSTDTIMRVGSLLFEAHVGASQIERALDLCDTLFYNLRQSRGGTEPQTLYSAERLTTLLMSARRARQTARVHEDILHDLDNHCYAGGAISAGRGSGDRQDDLRHAADHHPEGVRTCSFAARGGGTTATQPNSYSNLCSRLSQFGKLSVPSPGTMEDSQSWGEREDWPLCAYLRGMGDHYVGRFPGWTKEQEERFSAASKGEMGATAW